MTFFKTYRNLNLKNTLQLDIGAVGYFFMLYNVEKTKAHAISENKKCFFYI